MVNATILISHLVQVDWDFGGSLFDVPNHTCVYPNLFHQQNRLTYIELYANVTTVITHESNGFRKSFMPK